MTTETNTESNETEPTQDAPPFRYYDDTVAEDPAVRGAFYAFEDACGKYAEATGELELNNEAAYKAIEAAWYYSERALMTAIDAYVARQISEVLNPDIMRYQLGVSL